MRFSLKNSKAARECAALSVSGGVSKCRSPGFTLLELLVVLSIIGLMAAVALPQLQVLVERVEFALSREKIEQALAGLPYQALGRREDFVLGSPSKSNQLTAEKYTAAKEGSLSIQDVLDFEGPVLATNALIAVPEGWTLELPKPIFYKSNGFCSGGEITVKVGNQEYLYKLESPKCPPVLQ